jgi:hypothetical protein
MQATEFLTKLKTLPAHVLKPDESDDIDLMVALLSIVSWPEGKQYFVEHPLVDPEARDQCYPRSLSSDYCERDARCVFRKSQARIDAVNNLVLNEIVTNSDAIAHVEAHGSAAERQRIAELQAVSRKLTDEYLPQYKVSEILASRKRMREAVGGLCEVRDDIRRWLPGSPVKIVERLYMNRGVFEGQFLAKVALLKPLVSTNMYGVIEGFPMLDGGLISDAATQRHLLMAFRFLGDGADHSGVAGVRAKFAAGLRASCMDALVHPSRYENQVERLDQVPLSFAHIDPRIKVHTGYFGMAMSLLCNTRLLETLYYELVRDGAWRVDTITLCGFSLGAAMSHMYTFLLVECILPLFHRHYIFGEHKAAPLPRVRNVSGGGPRTGNQHYAAWFTQHEAAHRLTMTHYVVADIHWLNVNNREARANTACLDPAACIPHANSVGGAVGTASAGGTASTTGPNDDHYTTVGCTSILYDGQLYRDSQATVTNQFNFVRNCRSFAGDVVNAIATGADRLMPRRLARMIEKGTQWVTSYFDIPTEFRAYWCLHNLAAYQHHTHADAYRQSCFVKFLL